MGTPSNSKLGDIYHPDFQMESIRTLKLLLGTQHSQASFLLLLSRLVLLQLMEN